MNKEYLGICGTIHCVFEFFGAVRLRSFGEQVESNYPKSKYNKHNEGHKHP